MSGDVFPPSFDFSRSTGVVLAHVAAWGEVALLSGELESGAPPRLPPELRPDPLTRFTHEMRGPLHVIVGFAELLQRAERGEVKVDGAELLGDIVASASEALATLDDLAARARKPEVARG